MSRFIAVMQDGMRVLVEPDPGGPVPPSLFSPNHVLAMGCQGVDDYGRACTIRGEFVMRVYRVEAFDPGDLPLIWEVEVPA